ncbi:response regulator [Streptomyces sp. NBC_01483]|uniref:response regulator n=1 Tax=Streptomyces sp. NBC_01483 TaxID=2903883 RepID=UPI002E37AD47|nr:response regulator transcription factor [Streptomyces sp. NBC_01483]
MILAACTDRDGGGTEPGISGSDWTLLIIDDDQLFRDAAIALLDGAGFRVLGDAADGATGVEQAERIRPDVVLLDVNLPDINGFELCRRLVDAGYEVVLCSVHEASDYGPLLAWSGARGFVPKVALTSQRLARELDG